MRNVRCLYRTVTKELSKYNKLDLVGVQVRWDEGGTEPYFFLWKGE
jgi:hypothetical protein